MKKKLLLFLLCLSNFVWAHSVNYDKELLRHWHDAKGSRVFDGSFSFYKNGKVGIEDAQNTLRLLPLASLSKADQVYVIQKMKAITVLNNNAALKQKSKEESPDVFTPQLAIVLLLLAAFAFYIFYYLNRQQSRYLIPVWLVGLSFTLFSFSQKAMRALQMSTSPTFIDSAFVPFKPGIHTFWDSTYFYVESKGIPNTHMMMVGISNHGWQQQVPIPQCYLGSNAWPIPLHPTFAANPIPVDSIHFTRGAIALAINGVPIFNVHTNTGVDSYLDGQLDAYGGHCGRADDYHYHIAPLHLYAYTAATMPIAFGLDGFGVYGNTEPDGTPMQVLDANHGHLFAGVYHYHGTATAPYMIANVVGQVTEDATHQLIPQAAAHPVRPSLTPLNGALITNCVPNSNNNGYHLTYTLSGQTDSIVYSWNTSGNYTFKFYTAGNGTATTQNYNGFTQCTVPTAVQGLTESNDAFSVFPNPSKGHFQLRFSSNVSPNEVKEISLYNLQGKLLINQSSYRQEFNCQDLSKGIYILRVQVGDKNLIQKILVD